MGFIVKKGPKGREAQNLTDNSSGNAILVEESLAWCTKSEIFAAFLVDKQKGEKDSF